jgi:serine/threonine protein kinase
LRYSSQAADAIAKAHSANILHQDLKPANLIVTNDGKVKVLDFGLAKLMRAPRANQNPTASATLEVTENGRVVGTPSYMSPEQAEGKNLDGRSDIFSFGAVLYEMTTGHRAFQGDTPMSTIGCVLRDEPKSVREPRRETPPELDRLIRRCLRKDPARRIQTMSDLKVALEELKDELDSGTLMAQTITPKRKNRYLWAVIATLSAVLVTMAAVRLKPSTPPPTPHPLPLPATKARSASRISRPMADRLLSLGTESIRTTGTFI